MMSADNSVPSAIRNVCKTIWTDRRTHTVFILHTCGRAKFRYLVLKMLLLLNLFYKEFVIFDSFLCFNFYKQPRHRFAYQWLVNDKVKKNAIFVPNLPCGSRVMSIFTNC